MSVASELDLDVWNELLLVLLIVVGSSINKFLPPVWPECVGVDFMTAVAAGSLSMSEAALSKDGAISE